MEKRNTRVRALAVLGLASVVMAVALLSPVGAAITKPKVKKIAIKQANKVVDAENAIVARDFPGGDIPGNSGFDLDNPNTIMGSLTVPAGSWAFHADFEVARSSSGIIVICQMRAGGTEVDKATSWFGGIQSQESVSLQHAAAFPNGGTVDVRCDDGTAATTEADFSGLEIIAVEGSSLA
jgi:hypothetical protein